MNVDVYDPYDMSLYSNKNTKKSSDQETNIFNDSNNDKNDDMNQNDNESLGPKKEAEEETKLKQKKKRKKTDEGLSENIDLSQNAYEETNLNETENNNNVNNEEDENELPLLEELGINPQNIKNKIIGVITLKKIEKKFFEDSDMAGPLLIFFLFAFSLVLQFKINFGYIYGISLFGSILLFLLLNLMSNNQNGIILYNTISVLGYCLIPIVLLSFIAVFMDMKNIIGGIISTIAIVLSSLNASRFFEIGLDMHSQRWLIFYPVALFYICFVLVTIY